MITVNKAVIQKVNEFISFFEGRKNTAYKDSGGVWTIGLGSTKNVTPGLVISEAEIYARFETDIMDAIDRANKNVSVTLNDAEKVAVISQAYNLRSFEKLADHLNQDRALYKKKLLLYYYDIAKHPVKGLLIRRIAERLQFEGRDWRTTATALQKMKLEDVQSEVNNLFTS